MALVERQREGQFDHMRHRRLLLALDLLITGAGDNGNDPSFWLDKHVHRVWRLDLDHLSTARVPCQCHRTMVADSVRLMQNDMFMCGRMMHQRTSSFL